tara:strand:- start:47 stop:451 length:405 start_codon:yes stop_codon:yes gene_type:complete
MKNNALADNEFNNNELSNHIEVEPHSITEWLKQPNPVTQKGVLTIDRSQFQVEINGEAIHLTLSEFKVLCAMAEQPGKVFTRAMLINEMVGYECHIVEQNINVHIQAIRRKLGSYRWMIETVRGIGYRYREEEK